MCGLFYTNKDITRKQFLKALNIMDYRGPDYSKVVKLEGQYFGHNRLKVLGLKNNSNQPYYSKTQQHLIIYNGEIYNFKELAKKYSIELSTGCDTELLIELFERLGPDFLNELNGMFALLIYNIENNSLFVARDRLGIKPLYYSIEKTVSFCSEPAPLKSIIDYISFDELGLRQYKQSRSFFNGHTLYDQIKMFPPGHYYLNGKFVRYWNLPDAEQAEPTDEELLYLIKSSIKYRMISDVPVGSYLSGGIDSSIISYFSKASDTWTVGQEKNNEFYWASLVAKRLRTNHHSVSIDSDIYIDTLKKMVEIRQEPLSVPNEVLIYKMTQKVKEKNTVILSGEGADELFFGYDRIFRWANNASTWDLKEFAKHYSYSDKNDLEIIEYSLEPFLHLKKPLAIVATFFQISHLHTLLRRLDYATMLCSVEARVPFVDHRIIERLAGVPIEYRMKNNIVKAPLKRICKNILPTEVVEREKVGFPVDLNEIFNNKLTFHQNMHLFFKVNLNILGADI